jgi:homeobox protein cut-like
VRYLQSFNGGGYSNGPGGAFSRGGRDLDLEALEERYEASMDPFRQFSRAERQRKFKWVVLAVIRFPIFAFVSHRSFIMILYARSSEMSPMEKIVFIVAKTTLGSKEMRTTLFFYVLAMHLLVFVTTYQWSHSTTCDSYHSQPNLAHFHGGVPLENAAGGVVNASIDIDKIN